MIQKDDIVRMIRNILENDLATSVEEIDGDSNLIAEGILDSISIMRLIAGIEAAKGFKIPPQDLVPRNFMTLNAMQRYIQARQTRTPMQTTP